MSPCWKPVFPRKDEPVYLLLGHVDSESQRKLKAKIFSKYSTADETRLKRLAAGG
ncbi:Uncharacterised protein [Serratia fonticola]|uniref:Uncharacterized protein n=1 Tax=Serratia fonticola TaxID=47917 RepID=A0A4U9TY90_SERFO|nr:Uncharacterised protein [Serratia fonticola]